MRIALAHNLRAIHDGTQVSFTSPRTRDRLVEVIGGLGHEVVPIEVSGPLPQVVAALLECRPDLVFNLAEGRSDGARQPFFTGLYQQLGLPFTGSGPRAQAVALDKHLTKLTVADRGVPVPPGQFVRDPAELDLDRLVLPAMVKPNFEATSRGITQDSVVSTVADARKRVAERLAEFPAGVLVEEYVPGRDLTLPYLAAVDNAWGGVLDVTEALISGGTGYPLLDYAVKNLHNPELARVQFRTPARLTDDLAARVRALTRTAVRAVGCDDIARVDFRLRDDGALYLLEVNALPNLAPQLNIHDAARLAGLDPTDGVVRAIIESASRRQGLSR